jgi:hypothetical protein
MYRGSWVDMLYTLKVSSNESKKHFNLFVNFILDDQIKQKKLAVDKLAN